MSLKHYNYSATELLDAVMVNNLKNGKKSDISVGTSLKHLGRLVNTGKEFKGDCDGLDALCYHLDSFTCKETIKSLQKILKRFKEI